MTVHDKTAFFPLSILGGGVPIPIEFIHNTTISGRRTGATEKKQGLVELAVTLMLGLRGVFAIFSHNSCHYLRALITSGNAVAHPDERRWFAGRVTRQRQSFDQVGVLHTWFAARACPANVFFSLICFIHERLVG